MEAIQEDVAWVCQVPMRREFFLQNLLGGLSSWKLVNDWYVEYNPKETPFISSL